MTGFSEYDLVGPSTFLAAGGSGRIRAFLGGFGYYEVADWAGLGPRLMRLLLLHRYSDLGVQVAIEGWQNQVRSFEELERLLWPLEAEH
jgi:hygromycin-B 7''-O-kinase